jgi:hypothetical protein
MPWRFRRGWKFRPAALAGTGMAKKPRIPDPASIIYCVACHKPTNGKGWFGPGCQCEVELNKTTHRAHSISAPRSNWG